MEGLYKFDQENLFLSNNYNKITEMELKMIYKLNIACQHLEFVKENYQLRCTLAIVTSLGGTASDDL